MKIIQSKNILHQPKNHKNSNLPQMIKAKVRAIQVALQVALLMMTIAAKNQKIKQCLILMMKNNNQLSKLLEAHSMRSPRWLMMSSNFLRRLTTLSLSKCMMLSIMNQSKLCFWSWMKSKENLQSLLTISLQFRSKT